MDNHCAGFAFHSNQNLVSSHLIFLLNVKNWRCVFFLFRSIMIFLIFLSSFLMLLDRSKVKVKFKIESLARLIMSV